MKKNNLDNWIVVENKDDPSKDTCWVEVNVRIRCNETGEVRTYISTEILRNNEEYPSTFNWAENNYSCDCNRELFFRRALAEDESDLDDDAPCTDGRFSIRLINPVTEEIYYKEF